MDRNAKVELVEALRERYVASEKQSKSRILDELVQITGYHRKYALRFSRKTCPRPLPQLMAESGSMAIHFKEIAESLSYYNFDRMHSEPGYVTLDLFEQLTQRSK